ncbi:MAG: hypothetical protein RJB66_1662 [Pseudomonadota bacterium]
MRKKKDSQYFKSLKKVKVQMLPNAMIPRPLDVIQDEKSKVVYLVDWRDRKYTSIKSVDLPKEKDWDYDRTHWHKISA